MFYLCVFNDEKGDHTNKQEIKDESHISGDDNKGENEALWLS